MILVEQKIKKSSNELQHLILYKTEIDDICLKYFYNKKEVFNITLFECFNNKYEYYFLDLDDYVNNIEEFFNSFYKVKEYIRLFLVESVNIENLLYTDDSIINKEIYSFFIKEYEMFL